MQRLLFSKIETWFVLLLTIFGLVVAILFGAAALKADRAHGKHGQITGAALKLSEVPLTAMRLLREGDTRVALNTAKLRGRAGWTVAGGDPGLAGEDYLLLSRFDGAEDQAIVELVDLRTMDTLHRWTPNAQELFASVSPVEGLSDMWNSHYFEAVHPMALQDGGLLIKDNYSPLFRIDACSAPVATDTSHVFHHSMEAAADGTLWVPVQSRRNDPAYGRDMTDDGLAHLTAEGEVIEIHSLLDIYVRHGLMAAIFGAGKHDNDPLHLNDIQPVLSDGPYWRKGDLFIDVRRPSTVLLYRPSTDEILWLKQGPWLGQHDVDILDDHRIMIFNNNAVNRGNGPEVLGANEVMIYDFSTQLVTSPYRQVLNDLDVMTQSEGLSDMTSQGNLLIEEENAGRILILALDGRKLAEFVNRAANGEVYTTSWSRIIDRKTGDRLRDTLAVVNCTEG